jgi:hypothetical protein
VLPLKSIGRLWKEGRPEPIFFFLEKRFQFFRGLMRMWLSVWSCIVAFEDGNKEKGKKRNLLWLCFRLSRVLMLGPLQREMMVTARIARKAERPECLLVDVQEEVG